jgi:hypothetical protein
MPRAKENKMKAVSWLKRPLTHEKMLSFLIFLVVLFTLLTKQRTKK